MDYTYIFFSLAVSIVRITSSDDVAVSAARYVCMMHFMVDFCMTF